MTDRPISDQPRGAAMDVPTEVFADHIVLRPPNRLKERVARRIDPKEAKEGEAIRRAEHALDLLSHEFGDWIEKEIAALEAARAMASHSRDVSVMEELYRCAHDLRGQAATFGFPLAGEVADGLCDLIEQAGIKPGHQELVDRHVQAIRAIVREDARSPDHPLGLALVRRLREVRNTITPRPRD